MATSYDMFRSQQQEAARALYEMSGLAMTANTTTTPRPPIPMLGAPLYLLPSLHPPQQHPPNHNHNHHPHLQILSPHLFMGGGALFAPAFPVFPSSANAAAATTSPATVTCQNPSATGEKRLSVAYLLNSDEPPTATSASTMTTMPPTFIKQEEPTSPEHHQPHQSKRKASSSAKAQKSQAKRSKTASTSTSSSFSSSSPLSTPPSPPAATTSTATAMAATFKGDLSLFPHLQLQLQREQLDPQQHTELVLKVWNRQQQVIKLQQLQQKKQELKAQRLQQRLKRKGHVVESTPGSPPSSTASPSSPTPASPTSSTSSADVVSAALPTLDEILNGADAQVDEASDEDSSNNKKTNSSSGGADSKKPRRRITAQQVAVLEQVFAVEPFPGPSTKKVIAKKLGMQERSITIWFQNKRARLKRIEGGDNNNNNGGSGEGEGGRREVTFHNLAVGFDGKLDMLPEDF